MSTPTPTPDSALADALRDLLRKWQKEARSFHAMGKDNASDSSRGEYLQTAAAFRLCAKELQAALAQHDAATCKPSLQVGHDAAKAEPVTMVPLHVLLACDRERTLYAKRLLWLHDCSGNMTDAEGCEWGIYRVKWKDGQAVEVWQTNSDFSDLDAEIQRDGWRLPQLQAAQPTAQPTAQPNEQSEDSARLDWLEKSESFAVWKGVYSGLHPLKGQPVIDLHDLGDAEDSLGDVIGAGGTLRAAIDAARRAGQ